MFFFERVFFLAGIPLTLFLGFYLKKYRDRLEQKQKIELDNFTLLEEVSKQFHQPRKRKLFTDFLRLLTICSLWVSLSKPIIETQKLVKSAQVILLLDLSKSMQAQDFRPNRLEAAKLAALEFLEKLPSEVETALIVFDREASIKVDFSKNRQLIRSAIKRIDLEDLGNGTALGEAILEADRVFRRKNQKSEQKNIVLLTDGESNSGIDPIEALTQITELKIYTVGIGSIFGTTVAQGLLTKLDSQTLQEIASLTEGQFFNVFNNTEELKEIYSSLSKNYRLENKQVELSIYFLLLSLLLISFLFARDFLKNLF